MSNQIKHNIEKLQIKILEFGSYASGLLIASIYFSTSLSTVLSVFIGLAWLFSGQFLRVHQTLLDYPVAAWAVLLYACFILGLGYGNASCQDGFAMLMKYRELFFIPVLIPFFSDSCYRDWAWRALLAVSVLTLIDSYLMDMGVLELNRQGDPSFKSRITHSIFIAFFAFYCAHKIHGSSTYRMLYLILLLLSVHNLFFVVEGRTGQLIAVGLCLLFAVQRLPRKKLWLLVLATAVFLAIYVNFSDKASRINEGIENTQAYLKPHPEQTDSSMGQRYTFWHYSLILLREKPIFGHGTGSFAKEYQRVAGEKGLTAQNPHNEFLMIGVQTGLFGILVYGGFLLSQFYYAKKLPEQEKWLAQGVLLSLIIASLFNSPFLDHSGHWFASLIALCFAGAQTASRKPLQS